MEHTMQFTLRLAVRVKKSFIDSLTLLYKSNFATFDTKEV